MCCVFIVEEEENAKAEEKTPKDASEVLFTVGNCPISETSMG